MVSFGLAPGAPSKAFHFQFGTIGMQIPARASPAPPDLDEQKRDQMCHYTSRSVPNIPKPSVPNRSKSSTARGKKKKKKILQKAESAGTTSDPYMAYKGPEENKETVPSESLEGAIKGSAEGEVLGNSGACSVLLPVASSKDKPVVELNRSKSCTARGEKKKKEILKKADAEKFYQQQKPSSAKQGITSVSSEISGAGNGADISVIGCDAKSKLAGPSPLESSGIGERGGVTLPERFKQDINPSDISSQSAISKSPVLVSQTERESVLKATAVCNEVPTLGTPEGGLGESARTATEADKIADNINVSTSGIVDSTDIESSHGNKTSTVDASSIRSDVILQQSAPDLSPEFLETIPKNKGEVLGNSGAGSVLLPVASSKDKPVVELNSSKSSTARGKKKKKEILMKADVEKFSQKPKTSSEPLVYKSLEGATKQSAAVSSSVSAESLASIFLSTAPSEESVPIKNVEGRRSESLSRSNSIKDHQKKVGNAGQIQIRQLVGGQSTTASSSTWKTAETGISSNSRVSETTEPKTTSESLSAIDASDSDISEEKADSTKHDITPVSSEISGAGNGADILDSDCDAKSTLAEHSPLESSGTEERGGEILPERFKQDNNPSDISSQSATSKCPKLVSQTEQESVLKATAVCNEVPILGTTEGGLGESARTATEADKVADNMDVSTFGIVDSTDVESPHGKKTSTVDASSIRSDVKQQQSAPVLAPEFLETIPKNEGEVLFNSGAGLVFLPVAISKDKPVVELNRSMSSTTREKKKKNEILQKADADKSCQQKKPSSKPSVYKLLEGATKQSASVSTPFCTESLASNFFSTAPSEEPVPITNLEGRRRESLSRSNSIKDHEKKVGKAGQVQTQQQRISLDADRWQRNANFQQNGLIPSPQTPLLMMHKAERKYEVGQVQDEEAAKQRRMRAILNKLTLQNFEKLFEQVKAVNIDNAVTLTGVVSQIFDRALMEPIFCEMYTIFCYYLAEELPDFIENNEKITFKRLLLNKCQEEFERGEREQEEANKADNEGEIKLTEEEREEKRIKARRRMLGNIRLIGELYKKKMLTERIMHECIYELLGQYENPDEEDVEALCKLMSTIGEMIDHPKAKENMDAYFDRMAKLSNNMKLSSRIRFVLKDAIELRKNKWQQRWKVEGPKKIEEVHRDAAQEWQGQASRFARGRSMNSSTRRVPIDYGPRGLSSPTNQMGSFHGMPTQNRGGYGAQNVWLEDRHSYEAWTLPVPLPQRPLGDDSLTLGPQGGLARGMSIRGPPTMSSTPWTDSSPCAGEPRRMTAGLNGFSILSEWPAYGSREAIIPRYHLDRFEAPPSFDQLTAQARNTDYGNRDIRTPGQSFDWHLATSPPTRGLAPVDTQNVPSEKVCPEERLRDMLMAAIKEFYRIETLKSLFQPTHLGLQSTCDHCQQLSQQNSKMSASWDSKSSKIFLDLCLEEVRNGGRLKNTLTVASWENVMKKFKEATDKDYTKKQFTNHWDALISDWKIFQSLKNLKTELGWQEENDIIAASEKWWSDRIQQDERYPKFRNKGLEHYELMEEVFGGTSATGADKNTLNDGLSHSSMVPEEGTTQIFNDGIQWQSTSNEYTLPKDDTLIPKDRNKSKRVKKKKVTSFSALNKSKGVKREKDTFKDSFDKLVTVFESILASSHRDKQQSQIERAILDLMDLPSLEKGSPVQVFGVQMMVNASWRQVFLALPKPELKLSFLKAEWDHKRGNASTFSKDDTSF